MPRAITAERCRDQSGVVATQRIFDDEQDAAVQIDVVQSQQNRAPFVGVAVVVEADELVRVLPQDRDQYQYASRIVGTPTIRQQRTPAGPCGGGKQGLQRT